MWLESITQQNWTKWATVKTKHMEKKMENTKTTEQKIPKPRKVAPKLIVKSLASRNSINELQRDNKNKNFVYTPAGTSAGSLSSQGLEMVVGPDGNPLKVGGRIVCEDTGNVRAKEVALAYDDATTRVAGIRDPHQVNSKDKTAVAKQPKS